jgi:hypothetical protein
MAFQWIGVPWFRLIVHQPDGVAGMATTEVAMDFGSDRGGWKCRCEHICEGTDLAEIVAPATEGEDLSH